MTPDAAEPAEPISPVYRLLHERTPRLIVTPALIAILVVIYAAMVVTSREINFSTGTLMAWGGLFAPAVASGEWWRLVTAVFLHGGPLHIGLNAFVLWRLGTVAERLLAPPVFLVVYLLTGVLASLASLQFHATPRVSIGASGAIFGIVGAMVAMVIGARGSLLATFRSTGVTSLRDGDAANPDLPPPLPTAQDQLRQMIGEMREQLFSFIVYNVAIGFMLPFVDNAAHLGGLAGGVAIGWLVGRRAFAERPRLTSTILPAVLTIALAPVVIGWVGQRADLASEVMRHETVDARAKEAFDRAQRDVQAGKQTAAAAADALQGTLRPSIRELQVGADALLAASRQRVDEASQRDRYGRPVGRLRLPGLQYDLDRAQAWSDFVTVYSALWQMRIGALRDGDRGLIRRSQQAEAEAVNKLNTVFKRPRPRDLD